MSSRYDEMMRTKNYLPFHLTELTPKLIQKAKEELKETDENRGPTLEQMRKLVLAEKNLTCPTEDEYLLQFLRARKFELKRAFNLFQTQFEVKKSYSEVYSELDIERTKKLIMTGPIYILPYRDPEGCALLVIKPGVWDSDEYSTPFALLALTLVLLALVLEPATQIAGVQILVDLQGFTFKQMRCITPRYIHLISRALRNCLPIRFKGIHIYHESVFFSYIWSVLKLFLSEKIKKRIHFHGDNQKHLHKHVTKEILPSEYGGDNNLETNVAYTWNQMERNSAFFERIIKCGYS